MATIPAVTGTTSREVLLRFCFICFRISITATYSTHKDIVIAIVLNIRISKKMQFLVIGFLDY